MLKRKDSMAVPVEVANAVSADSGQDEMTAMVYEGDLHALIEGRAAGEPAAPAATKGMIERLRDAVWPFLR
jgi:hypothetical protein